VVVNSDGLNLGVAGEVTSVIDIPVGFNNVTITIYTKSGELIKTIELDSPKPGFFQFTWDGTTQNAQRVAAGKYRVEVHGTSSSQEIKLKTMTSANVDSVSLGHNGDGLKLHVAGVGSVRLDQVKKITV